MVASRSADVRDPAFDAAVALLDDLTSHDALLRLFLDIHLDRVRFLYPLGDRADTQVRAQRRLEALPTELDLEGWYVTLKAALAAKPDRELSRRLVETMMNAMHGAPVGDLVLLSFVIALEDARMPPTIVAGSVKRAWTTLRSKPSGYAFLRMCMDHRRETEEALDQVVKSMGLRRDARNALNKTASRN